MKKVLVVGSCILCCMLFLTGCGEKKTKKKIGVVMSSLATQFDLDLKEGIEKQAAEYGYDVVVLDSDDQKQIETQNISKMTNLGISAVILDPVDVDLSVSSIEKLTKKSIPIVVVNQQLTKTKEMKLLSTVLSNEEDGGRIAGEYLLSLIGPKTRVIEMEGPATSKVTEQRHDGFHHAVDGDISIIATRNMEYDRATALSEMETLLISNGQFDGVFAQNDEIAIGAAEALEHAGMTNVKIVGMDATTDGINALENGKIAGTIAKQPKEIGQTAVRNLYDHFSGKDVSESTLIDFKLIK